MKATVLTGLLASVVIAGCSSPPALREMAGVRDEASWSGVALAVEVPGRQFSASQFVPVYVRLTNMNSTPVTIQSPNNQEITISVFVPTPVGWKKLKDYYPTTLAQAPTTWTLAAGQSQVFSVPLTVEAEWPTNSDVRLIAEVNGRPQLRTAVEVFILPVRPTTP